MMWRSLALASIQKDIFSRRKKFIELLLEARILPVYKTPEKDGAKRRADTSKKISGLNQIACGRDLLQIYEKY